MWFMIPEPIKESMLSAKPKMIMMHVHLIWRVLKLTKDFSSRETQNNLSLDNSEATDFSRIFYFCKTFNASSLLLLSTEIHLGNDTANSCQVEENSLSDAFHRINTIVFGRTWCYENFVTKSQLQRDIKKKKITLVLGRLQKFLSFHYCLGSFSCLQ